ncbi:MAG: hypothetical protein ACLFU8_06335 [Anaerolineales bacterium]
MSLQAKVIDSPQVALLCQNHPIYLAHAAKIGTKYPERPLTFRTHALWRSGAMALEAHGPRTLYLVPEGEELVRYTATLEQVCLEPQAEDPEVQALLEGCLPETRDQGLWEQYGERVRTLYVISHCRELAPPFPYTSLTKVSDEELVDEHYTYGYVLVYEQCPACSRSPCHCSG